MAPIAFCIKKYCIISFQYVCFIPVQPVLAITFRYDIYRYHFAISKPDTIISNIDIANVPISPMPAQA